MDDLEEKTEFGEDRAWRRPAPISRRAAMALYAWREPGWPVLISVGFVLPIILAALLAPALLSLAPTAEMIAPIAGARAVAAGALRVQDSGAPFYAMLLLAADFFTDIPGRIHLIAKALSAALVTLPLAYFAAVRLPVLQAVLLTASTAAYVVAPFAGAAEFALALFMTTAFVCLCAPADDDSGRAALEGTLTGAGIFILWLLSPVFSLGGFLALAVCPFLTGKAGLRRYCGALATAALFAGAAELIWPGLNAARAAAASGIFDGSQLISGGERRISLGGATASMLVVLASAAVFGGRNHAKGWGVGAALALLGVLLARLAGADALPLFALAAAVACFSVASPFYDGVFRSHDRASVAVALSAAGLTLFWTAAPITHAAGEFAVQYDAAKHAPADIRTRLGLVQPGGPTIARWVEEGRFSTPEAREQFALAPSDQSAMLLEAAGRARAIAGLGVDVAILTGGDTACVLADDRECRSDGPSAARAAKIVFVPRLDLDAATVAAKGKVEALLYTEFQLAEQTALWDIWVRRDAKLPADVAFKSGAGAMLR
ncbi:MAG: hypothetical protein ACE5FO_05750 [Parvularculaceae bacterium]